MLVMFGLLQAESSNTFEEMRGTRREQPVSMLHNWLTLLACLLLVSVLLLLLIYLLPTYSSIFLACLCAFFITVMRIICFNSYCYQYSSLSNIC